MRRRSIGVVITALLMAAGLLVAAPNPASATAASLGATTYTANADNIAGWDWVRSAGQNAVWTFDLAGLSGARSRSAYLNVSGLVTNGVTGGSGYSAMSVKFNATCESGSQLLIAKLVNPFRPTDPVNSGGIGYAAYGASSSSVNLPKFAGCTTLTVTAAYPFTSGRHIAFKKDALTIGFSK
ncbi:unannotated protein [freshwater metagenome]|uniref:Unannotated protein n=1 Tax=freshwater metagenome TaxID=449393 RepID=A0A6J6SZR9_9ZZZZ|nr:hypothetical protein [Actinomycetota bacterium]